MSRPWFRFYAEFVSDPKVQLLAFDDQRHYVCLLCLKCNGTLDSKVRQEEFRDRMIAKALGLDLNSALEARRRLQEIGIVDADWQPAKWEDRQYLYDHSTPRVRAFRERALKGKGKSRSKRDETVSETDKIRTEQNRTDGKRGSEAARSGSAPRSSLPNPEKAPGAKAVAARSLGEILRRDRASRGG